MLNKNFQDSCFVVTSCWANDSVRAILLMLKKNKNKRKSTNSSSSEKEMFLSNFLSNSISWR